MKRNWTLTVFLLVLSAAMVYGWPNAKMMEKLPGSALGWDDANGVWRPMYVNSDGKLVTDAAVTIGSVSVTPGTPPDQNSQTAVSVTSSAQNVTSLANRQSVSIWNLSSTETVWVSLDSTTASATTDAPSIPIRPYGYISVSLDSSKVVSLVTSTTATATVYQDGY